MYLFHRLDVKGKRPVWPVAIFLLDSIALKKVCWVRGGLSGCCVLGGGAVAGGVWGLVDQAFCQSCQRWPFAVASDLARCFRTKLEVRPGHVVN